MKGDDSDLVLSKVLAFVWIVSIATVSYLSLKPKIEFPLDFEKADLVYHLIAYLWLSILPFFIFRREKTAYVFALLMLPLGAALELAQIAVPGRVSSPMDIGANSVGVILGLLCAKLLAYRLSRRSRETAR